MIKSEQFGKADTTNLNGDVQARNGLNNSPMLNVMIKNDVNLCKRDELKSSMSIDFTQPRSMKKHLLRYATNYFGDPLTPQSGSPSQTDCILKTPDLIKCLLPTPEMEKWMLKS